jgi:hypothetical protein
MRTFAVLLAALVLLGAGVLVAQATPDVPGDLVALWMAGLGVVTSIVTQALKWIAAPIADAPDWLKAVIALAVSFVATKLSELIGAPIPPDLAGFAAVIVHWAAAMGLHAFVKKVVPQP